MSVSLPNLPDLVQVSARLVDFQSVLTPILGGPVQTIRTVGYVGLAVLLLGQIVLARSAYRLIMRCKGTEWFSVALIFGIPMVIYPFQFVFVFGHFGAAASFFFIHVGLVKLLHANLPVPEYSKKHAVIYRSLSSRQKEAS
jgi:hypothetical protein